MISGSATAEGTSRFAVKHKTLLDFWRKCNDLTLSTMGIGTYLGDPDIKTDEMYASSIYRAIELGINVIDTAINYRFQKSERNVGQALKKVITSGLAKRDEFFICTKGGFISGEGSMPSREWVAETFVNKNIASISDFIGGYHCMSPKYLKNQVDQSRSNLGIETIDVYYVHNPETQIPSIGRDAFYRRLTDAFKALEECVMEKKIRWYGTATWNAYRVPKTNREHISLDSVIECAIKAGGTYNHFKFIQLPFNLGLPEAFIEATQEFDDEYFTILDLAKRNEIAIIGSASLLQARLLGRVPDEFRSKFPTVKKDHQICLQFARSTPGILTALCGMKNSIHVEENMEIAKIAPLTSKEFISLFSSQV
ncbi:MAG: aldo/keto reductase [Planctomycetes bacterium]|nr:aldo/keto reductase [Planctomycetota bacterium]